MPRIIAKDHDLAYPRDWKELDGSTDTEVRVIWSANESSEAVTWTTNFKALAKALVPLGTTVRSDDRRRLPFGVVAYLDPGSTED